MASGLDAVDRRIPALLVEDGRMPAAVDPLPPGYASIGHVAIDVAPKSLQDVAARLVGLDQVSYGAGSVGDGDLLVQVYARDPEEPVRLVNEVIDAIPGVTRVRTTMVPWKLKEVCDWQVPAETAEQGAAMV